MTASPDRRRSVFVDVDGTLMKNGHYIPASAARAIAAARANGHLVFLSTGRGHAELDENLMSIGFDGAVSNGGAFATLRDRFERDEIIVSRLFAPDAVRTLQGVFARHGVEWYFQAYDRMFASPGLPAVLAARLERDRIAHTERARGEGLDPADLPFYSVGMKTFDDDVHFTDSSLAKAVLLADDAAVLDRLLAEIADEFAVVSGTIPLPDGASAEVAPAGVNKGATILELLAHLGLDPRDAIGIGDNWNDAEMFEVCGLSIAMGNAAPDVQKLADEVTTAIDDDGIWNAFTRHGLV